MPDTQYLIQRHQTWWVRVAVPPHLRGKVINGRKIGHGLMRTLKTHSLNEANRLKHGHVDEFKRLITSWERGEHNEAAASVIEASLRYREALKRYTSAKQAGWDDLAAEEHTDEVEQDIEVRLGTQAAQQAVALAENRHTLIEQAFPLYTREISHPVRRKDAESRLRRFIAWAAKHECLSVETVSWDKAGAYLTHLVNETGLSQGTVKAHIQLLVRFWNWMGSRGGFGVPKGAGDVPVNPWANRTSMDTALRATKKTSVVVAYTDEELVKLLSAQARGAGATGNLHDAVQDVIKLMLFCGQRRDMVCNLRKDQIVKSKDGYWYKDVSSKGVTRSLPAASQVAHIIKRRLKTPGELLFPELTSGQSITRAFAKLAKRTGVKNDRSKCLHSLRHTFTAVCKAQGVPTRFLNMICGRTVEDDVGEQYDRANSRVSGEVLRDIVEKAHAGYSAKVLALVAK